MDDDDQVSNFDDKTYLRPMVFELKRIIDVQAETIKDNDNVIEIQLETMKEGLGRMNDMREETDYLSTQLTEQRELAKASEAKAEFFKT